MKALANQEPWPNLVTARLFLSELVQYEAGKQAELSALNHSVPADWIVGHELAPLANAHLPASDDKFSQQLRQDSYLVAAQNAIHLANVKEVLAALQNAGIHPVLLKGIALAHTIYADPSHRTMSDIDFWLTAEDMDKVMPVLEELGFEAKTDRKDRPLSLQILSKGEIQFYRADWGRGLVELHWSPFPGWWLQRTAAVDDAGIWARCETFEVEGMPAKQLSPEDALIHLAVHLGINHQFHMGVMRGLMDIALSCKVRPVNWNMVVERAISWRVKIVVWLALSLAAELIGQSPPPEILTQLQPSKLKRLLLSRLVTAQTVLAGYDITTGVKRFLLLFLLVDRFRDAMRLAYRIVWPEPTWLEARYGVKISPWQHIRQLIRQRKI